MSARSRFTAGLLAALTSVLASASPSSAASAPSLDALDLIELEVSYTTLLARYYEPLTPRLVAEGARTGIAAELERRGIDDASLPYVPQKLDFASGADLIDGYVLRSLARYGAKLDGHALVHAAVAGELGILHDPYTVIFRPQAFEKFNAFLGNGAFGGIGAVVSLDASAGRAPIESTFAGSPAAEAGLVRGDAIVAIDGKPVSSFANAQALLGALRGKIGTPVALAVARADATMRTFTIVRAAIHDPEVETKRFGDVAYIRLARFGDRAGEDTAAAVDAAERDGARGIVLDVRGNGGGYGDEATKVASIFVPGGPVFTTRERTGAPVVSRASGRPSAHVPLAVLVDGDTASAAEIVAGAIQDDGAGRIVGVRTFGKGVVQSIFPLPDGSAIKMTTARYVTPKGRDIEHVGIEPDIVVRQPADARFGDPASDPQLAAAIAAIGR